MDFGKKIQSLRKKQGLSQEELAEMLSVTRQTVSKWELGQSTPDLQYIAQISEMFGVTTDYLIKDAVEDSDKKAEKSSGAEVPEKADHSPFLRFLGTVLTIFGLIVVIIFIVLSCVHPWGALNNLGYFEGLLGYLFGTGSMPYFIIGCMCLISGITIFGIYAYRKK